MNMRLGALVAMAGLMLMLAPESTYSCRAGYALWPENGNCYAAIQTNGVS